MRRLHLLELEDQAWFPTILRNCMTDLLNFFMLFFGIYDPIVPLLYDALKKTSSRHVVDLCSGGAGAIRRVQHLLKHKYNYDIEVTLSDLYPNAHALERVACLQDASIRYLSDSIDATKVPSYLKGFRTLFTSFHHFDALSAQKLLSDAINTSDGIAIFEFSERTWRGVLGPLLSPMLTLILTPFIKPFLWQRLFFTYLCPAIPAAFIFDGIMSQLRSYTPSEMLKLAQDITDSSYVWEAGFIKHKYLPFRVNYLIGLKAKLLS